MKRIDRYVLVAFLVRLFGVAGVVLFLYVTYDILTRIDHLRNAGFGRAMGMLLAYYGYLVPTIMLDTIPDLLLLATGLTLVEMSRARELLILKAGGVNVRRVSAPIFAVVLLTVIVTSWAGESVMPEFTRKQHEKSQSSITTYLHDRTCQYHWTTDRDYQQRPTKICGNGR